MLNSRRGISVVERLLREVSAGPENVCGAAEAPMALRGSAQQTILLIRSKPRSSTMVDDNMTSRWSSIYPEPTSGRENGILPNRRSCGTIYSG